MPTECIQDSLDFGTVQGRRVVGAFDGGAMTSDGGALLLGATDKAIRLIERFAACFSDARAPELIEHSLDTLVGQRVFGLALGYEDLVDHDLLRHDPVMATLIGKLQARREDCAPLAGKSTLNRLEQSLRSGVGRYHKIGHDTAAIEALFVTLVLEAHRRPSQPIVLDLDATDDPLHGHQEGRFFRGYYDTYCYLPLYIFCGRHLLCSKLRRANIDAARKEVERIVKQIRARWPNVGIVLRADSGFCRDDLMSWCEENRVEYVFGLARNRRLVAKIKREFIEARTESRASELPARRFKVLDWSTRSSWSRARRIVAKAQWTSGKANPRFIVTSLPIEEGDARIFYEGIYCQRGDMENRIKECQTRLFADDQHLSTAGQKIQADYYYSLIVAPSQISFLAENAVKLRSRSILAMQNQIGVSQQSARGPLGVNVWATGDTSHLSMDNYWHFPGDPATPLSLLAGLDYRIDRSLIVGGAVSTGTQRSTFSTTGDFTQDEVAVSLYAAYARGALWGDVVGTYGRLDYTVNRNVPIGITLQFNNGRTSGNNWSLATEGGYKFTAGPLTHGPVAGIALQRADVNDFVETGGFTSLGFGSQVRDSMISALGYRATRDLGGLSLRASRVEPRAGRYRSRGQGVADDHRRPELYDAGRRLREGLGHRVPGHDPEAWRWLHCARCGHR